MQTRSRTLPSPRPVACYRTASRSSSRGETAVLPPPLGKWFKLLQVVAGWLSQKLVLSINSINIFVWNVCNLYGRARRNVVREFVDQERTCAPALFAGDQS